MKNAFLIFCALGWASNAGVFINKRDAPAAAANAALAVGAGVVLYKRLK